MQPLTDASYYFFRYNTTTVNWDSIENSINISDVTFACLAATNHNYNLFGKLVEGLSPLPITDTLENPVIDTHYG